MHCPDWALHAELWRAACLAAVREMERGRVTATLAKPPAPPLPAYLAFRFACIGACSDLEDAIADYAALGKCRPAARACVLPPNPPFFWVGTLASRASWSRAKALEAPGCGGDNSGNGGASTLAR